MPYCLITPSTFCVAHDDDAVFRHARVQFQRRDPDLERLSERDERVLGAKPACAASDFSIGGSVGTTTVASGTGVGSWSGLTIQLLNTAANQDNCKGATANISYTANP